MVLVDSMSLFAHVSLERLRLSYSCLIGGRARAQRLGLMCTKWTFEGFFAENPGIMILSTEDFQLLLTIIIRTNKSYHTYIIYHNLDF